MGRARNSTAAAAAADGFTAAFGARRGYGAAERDQSEARAHEQRKPSMTAECVHFEWATYDTDGNIDGSGSRNVAFEEWAESCLQDWDAAFEIAERMFGDGNMTSRNGSEREGFEETYEVTDREAFEAQYRWWRKERTGS